MDQKLNYREIIKLPLIISLAVIVLRLILEFTVDSSTVHMIFGVAWIHMLVPIYFALKVMEAGSQKPFVDMLKVTAVFTLIVRLIIAVEYALAYGFSWQAARFGAARGGAVGAEGATALQGYLLTPFLSLLFWFIGSIIFALILGGITVAIKRRGAAASAA